MSYCLYLVLMHAQVLAHCGTVDNPDNGPVSKPDFADYGNPDNGSDREPKQLSHHPDSEPEQLSYDNPDNPDDRSDTN